jgi:hypothetical protein
MLTLTNVVSNKLTFLNIHSLLGLNPGVFGTEAGDCARRKETAGDLLVSRRLKLFGWLRQATLVRRSLEIRLDRLSMLIGRPMT